MFARSVLNQSDPTEAQLNCLIAGENITVKMVADQSPSRLGPRIAEGEDVIAIWFNEENQETLRSVSERIGYVLPSTAGAEGRNHLVPIHQMTGREILEFCRTAQVHPAHLVPLKPVPEFSLPAPLLELLIDMMQGEDVFTANDKELAKVAVAMEIRRIGLLLSEKEASEEQNNPVKLMQVFSSVLDDPILMRRLARDSAMIDAVLAHESLEKIPLATRVKYVAYSGHKDKFNALKLYQKSRESFLDDALEKVETEYSKIFNTQTSESSMLLFVADIKDALLDRDIEPKSATINDILEVLTESDFKGSRLEKAFEYCYSRFGLRQDIKENSRDFLNELAVNAAFYFATEYRLSKFKRRNSKEINAIPSRNDIETLFADKSFEEGKLFRRLMDNRVMIACAFQGNSAQPAASPK